MESNVKKVAAAIIVKGNKVFAAQKGSGELKGGWEFPGGKVEPGETSRQAIVREIKEELDTKIEAGELFDTIAYDYPAFHLIMDCFICEVKSGDLILKEHENAKWLRAEDLDAIDWLSADRMLIPKLKDYMNALDC